MITVLYKQEVRLLIVILKKNRVEEGMARLTVLYYKETKTLGAASQTKWSLTQRET
jgi:hypothetical protein